MKVTASVRWIREPHFLQTISDIKTPYLWDYIAERKISPLVAQKYLVELDICFPYGKYPQRISKVVGFKSDSGGYEMRNKVLKICNSPKDVTTIQGNSDKAVMIFEGFFSFLSCCEKNEGQSIPFKTIILNSLSFLPQVLSFIGKDAFVYSYLDNDIAGDKATQLISENINDFVDMRCTYQDYNDLNDMLCGKHLVKKKSFFIKDFLHNSII